MFCSSATAPPVARFYLALASAREPSVQLSFVPARAHLISRDTAFINKYIKKNLRHRPAIPVRFVSAQTWARAKRAEIRETKTCAPEHAIKNLCRDRVGCSGAVLPLCDWCSGYSLDKINKRCCQEEKKKTRARARACRVRTTTTQPACRWKHLETFRVID